MEVEYLNSIHPLGKSSNYQKTVQTIILEQSRVLLNKTIESRCLHPAVYDIACFEKKLSLIVSSLIEIYNTDDLFTNFVSLAIDVFVLEQELMPVYYESFIQRKSRFFNLYVNRQIPVPSLRLLPEFQEAYSLTSSILKRHSLAQNSNKAEQTPCDVLFPKSLLEKYDYVCFLGSGGYSRVYKFSEKSGSTFIAVKVINKLFDNLIDTKRILREVHAQRQLHHVNILRILEIYHNNTRDDFDQIFIVLEYLPFTLHDILYSHTDISWSHELIRIIFTQIANGLAYLHARNLLHRDIKPANILIDEFLNVKIADFSLVTADQQKQTTNNINSSSSYSASSLSSHLQWKSLNVCSRWYRAPEIILLNPCYDTKVDLWSIGCIFAELLQNLVPSSSLRGVLFPGQSCYPISPPSSSPSGIQKPAFNELDQLFLIINILGQPDMEDLSAFISKQSTVSFVKAITSQPTFHITQLYSGTSSAEQHILQSLIQFNPHRRPSCEQLLSLPYFAIFNTEELFYHNKREQIHFDFDRFFSQDDIQQTNECLDVNSFRLLFVREFKKLSQGNSWQRKITTSEEEEACRPKKE